MKTKIHAIDIPRILKNVCCSRRVNERNPNENAFHVEINSNKIFLILIYFSIPASYLKLFFTNFNFNLLWEII